jgi:glycogen synthase
VHTRPTSIAIGAPRRVLMTADAVGGVFSYALELTRALRPLGIDVALAIMGRAPSRDQRAALRRLRHVEAFVGQFDLEWMPDPWDDVRRAGEWLLKLQAQVQPDVVHLNGYVHAALPWRVPTVVVAHSCVLSWWQAVRGEAAPASWHRYQHEVARGIACAQLVVAPTRAMLDAIIDHYGRPRRAHVIPNAVDASAYRTATKQPLVLGAGRVWDEAKNLAALAAVARELSWQVAIAGERAESASPEQAQGVSWLGGISREALRSWYAASAIYASPARYEPFGLSVLEAAHAGCALVLGDIPSLRENWSGAALFVAPDDHAALRDALGRLIGDAELRQDLGRAAAARGAQFEPARMAQAYAAAYAQLCAPQVARGGSQPCAL